MVDIPLSRRIDRQGYKSGALLGINKGRRGTGMQLFDYLQLFNGVTEVYDEQLGLKRDDNHGSI